MFLRNDYFFRLRIQTQISNNINPVFNRNVFGNFPSVESYYHPEFIWNRSRVSYAVISQMSFFILNDQGLSFLYGITMDRTSMDAIVRILMNHNIAWWAEMIYQKLLIKCRYQTYTGLDMINDELLATSRSIWRTFFDMIEERIRRDGFYI